MNLSKKNLALITGASRGIGKAILELLLNSDIDYIIGTATSQKACDDISQIIKKFDKQGKGMLLKLEDNTSIDNLIKNIISEFKIAPSILINNAGITKDNLLLRMKAGQWTDVININLNGTFFLTQKCIKHMVKNRWGRIINISSVVASYGNPGQANYVASKGAIESLTKTMAKELASRNITVNSVAPGFIATDMTASLNEKQKEYILNMIPLKRIGEPQEIAELVAFLVSNKSSYITGQVLHVNGGMY